MRSSKQMPSCRSFKAREVRFFIRKLICITIMHEKMYVWLLVILFRIPT